jgi:hypothetical protein
MTRRLFVLLWALALVLVACGAPAAPALTDPKEILTQSVLSLKDVKTLDLKGTLTGSVQAEGMGAIPLDGTTFSLAMDVAGKKLRALVDAPAFLGTKAEAILLDTTAYYKVAGPLASFVGADAGGKFTKVDAGAMTDTASTSPADVQKQIDELKAALDKLPSPPTKQADEKCGDADCYHINIALSSEQLQQMGASEAGAIEFSMTVDYWARKNDLRPAKIAFGIDAGAQGAVTATFDLTYDGAITVEAPPADQIANP